MGNMEYYLKKKNEERMAAIDEFYLEWEIRHPDMKPPPIIFEDDVIEIE